MVNLKCKHEILQTVVRSLGGWERVQILLFVLNCGVCFWVVFFWWWLFFGGEGQTLACHHRLASDHSRTRLGLELRRRSNLGR